MAADEALEAAREAVREAVGNALLAAELRRDRTRVDASEARGLAAAAPFLLAPLPLEASEGERPAAVCLDEGEELAYVATTAGRLFAVSTERERAPARRALPGEPLREVAAVACGSLPDGRSCVALAGRGELLVTCGAEPAAPAARWAYPGDDAGARAVSVAFGESGSHLVVALDSGLVAALRLTVPPAAAAAAGGEAEAEPEAAPGATLEATLLARRPGGGAPRVHALSGVAERELGEEPRRVTRGVAAWWPGEDEVRAYAIDGGTEGPEPDFCWMLTAPVTCTAVDETTARLAAGAEDGSVHVFGTVDGQSPCGFSRHRGPVDAVSFASPRRLVSAGAGSVHAHALPPAAGEEGVPEAAAAGPFTVPAGPVAALVARGRALPGGRALRVSAVLGSELVLAHAAVSDDEGALLVDARSGEPFARLDLGGLCRPQPGAAVGGTALCVLAARVTRREVPLTPEPPSADADADADAAAGAGADATADAAGPEPPAQDEAAKTRTVEDVEWHALVYTYERVLRGLFQAVHAACLRAWRGNGYALELFGSHTLADLREGRVRAATGGSSRAPPMVARFLQVQGGGGGGGYASGAATPRSTGPSVHTEGTPRTARDDDEDEEREGAEEPFLPFNDPATAVYEHLKGRAESRGERTARLERRKDEIEAALTGF